MIATRVSSVGSVGALIAVCAVCFDAGSAWAQGDAQQAPRRDPIGAEALFARGKQLMDQGHTGEACEAFKESQRLDPAGGTLTRLALCHEADGKLASAWLEFTEVVRISQAAGDQGKLAERVRLAREHLAAIEPRLPKLVVSVPAGSHVDGLAVTANGLPRNEGSWGVAIPVDPGEVTIEATAPGRTSFRTVVRAEAGKEASIEIPHLEPAAAPAVAVTPSAPRSEERPEAGPVLRPIALAVGAAGVVALGIGTYFGVTAMSKWNDSNKNCPASACNAQGVSSAHDAKSAATISDVTVGIGVAAVAAGVILYFVGAPKSIQPRADGVAVAF